MARLAIIVPGAVLAAVLVHGSAAGQVVEPPPPEGEQEPPVPVRDDTPRDEPEHENAVPDWLRDPPPEEQAPTVREGPGDAPPHEQEPPVPAGLGDTNSDDEPAVPAGLGDANSDDEPAVPAGLGDTNSDDEPAVPAGLGDADAGTVTRTGSTGLPLELRLSADARVGSRVRSDPVERTLSLAELRVQLDASKSWRRWSTTARLVVDGVGDPLGEDQAPQLETGQGAVDLRVASISVTPTDWLDMRLGRHILTWGTGDLVFINDLFPKDWNAFLLGRDIDYLKAPSDAARIGIYTSAAAIDVVFTPRFDADRFPLRDRVSTFDPALGRLAGRDDPLMLETPDRWFRDGELAVRVHRTVGSWELAGYGYHGFWKSPAGATPATGAGTFPALSVYGGSVRGPVGRGIAHVEAGYYDSRDDRGGGDPFVRNSELRGLVGYERQLIGSLVASGQAYVEAMTDHDGYAAGLPPDAPVADAVRTVLTTRLRWMSPKQQLALSLFALVSPSDKDSYVRTTAAYRPGDRWALYAGSNLFVGQRDHTFFGQLENNTNVYIGVRYAR